MEDGRDNPNGAAESLHVECNYFMRLDRLSLLVVEDNEVYRMALSTALDRTEYSFDVMVACNGEGALKKLRSSAIDCILTDFQLPDMDALGLLELIASNGLPDLPVIVMTGMQDAGMGEEPITKGVQDYLVKGDYDMKLLTRSIRYAMQRHSLTRELNEMNGELQEQSRLLQIQKKEIEEKAMSLEEASNYRSSFLRRVSHDLRDPLNCLLTLSDVFCQGARNLTEDQRRHAYAINEAGKELLSSVENIELCAKSGYSAEKRTLDAPGDNANALIA